MGSRTSRNKCCIFRYNCVCGPHCTLCVTGGSWSGSPSLNSVQFTWRCFYCFVGRFGCSYIDRSYGNSPGDIVDNTRRTYLFSAPLSLGRHGRGSMMIAMQNVSYDTAQRRILHNITLRLWKGKLIALVGPNGAGKSTLLRLLSGEYVPSEGWVKLHDKPLAAYSNLELARQRAVMPQDISLTFTYTAQDVVAMVRYPYEGQQRLNDDALIRQCMEQTDTWHLAQRLYPTLSGGEQARVTLARVLAQQTPVVLLDEPTASLDPHHQHRVLSVARSIARRGGVVLTILHDLNLASQ